MKYIKLVPKEVELRNLAGGTVTVEDASTYSFKRFLLDRLGDPKFASDAKHVLASFDIKQAIDKAGTVLALESEHYKLLREVVETPSQPFGHPSVTFVFAPFIRAVLEKALDQEPVTDVVDVAREG